MSVDVLPRVAEYLLYMPHSPMKLFHQWFTAGNTGRIILSVYFQREFFFCAHFPTVKLSVFIFFTNRIWNYRWMLCRQMYSIWDLVSKIFKSYTDRIVLLVKLLNVVVFNFNPVDTTKRLMSSPKCRSVEVINNPARPGSNHREVYYINYS
jgi:hypothetical protein